MKKYKYYIGIDCGVQTGICVYTRLDKSIRHLATVKIHEAIKAVESWKQLSEGDLLVRVEDARKRNWFGKADREKLQGAGSIKRDSGIWEDFLYDLGVNYEMVAPKNNKTKVDEKLFKIITGYNGRCSVHARDAAMLVWGM